MITWEITWPITSQLTLSIYLFSRSQIADQLTYFYNSKRSHLAVQSAYSKGRKIHSLLSTPSPTLVLLSTLPLQHHNASCLSYKTCHWASYSRFSRLRIPRPWACLYQCSPWTSYRKLYQVGLGLSNGSWRWFRYLFQILESGFLL